MDRLSLRRANAEDCRLYFEWANDAAVRKTSFHSDPIDWETHQRWFEEKLRSPGTRLFVLMRDQIPAGQIRLDFGSEGGAEIGISIAARERGRGLASEGLRLVLAEKEILEKTDRFIARARTENTASIAAFRKAGFVEKGIESVNGAACVRLERVSNRS